MRSRLFFLLLTIIFLGGGVTRSVQAQDLAGGEDYAGDIICLPDAYLGVTSDCLPLGPSIFLTQMASKGIPYPLLPLPAKKPDASLNELSIRYAKLNVDANEPVAIYSNVADASTGNNALRYLPPGALRYVAYKDRLDMDGGHYVQLQTHEWVRASPAILPVFQGLLLKRNPTNSFGWIAEQTVSRYEPSYQSMETGHVLPREQVVQVYETHKEGENEWFMIGLNEWVDQRYLRVVTSNNERPEGVDSNRWIEINLFQQTLTVYENGRLIFATLIASGVDPYFTQPGLFRITQKKPTETMTGAFAADKSDYYYLEDVPWTMYFDKARALHGAYWRAMFGYPQSHGCVNMSIGDSRWLFDWAKEGDWVYAWDPSGQTPIDPAAYTDGGA